MQTDYNGYPVRLCICECEDCGCTDQFWLDESLEKAKEELKNGTSVLLEWDYEEKQKGWICPRCNKVNAPSVKECDCEIKSVIYNKNLEHECKHEYVIISEDRISKSDSIMYLKCKKCGHIKNVHKMLIH